MPHFGDLPLGGTLEALFARSQGDASFMASVGSSNPSLNETISSHLLWHVAQREKSPVAKSILTLRSSTRSRSRKISIPKHIKPEEGESADARWANRHTDRKSAAELKALFDVVVPGYMPTEAHFKELFVNPIEKNQDPEKKALLARFIRHFILRRKKSEVLLELPEKIEEIAYCDLSEEQEELYRQVYLKQKESLLQDLENKSKPIPYMHVFALLSTLKQICDHPCLITKKFRRFSEAPLGKWDLFVELLQESARQRAEACRLLPVSRTCSI